MSGYQRELLISLAVSDKGTIIIGYSGHSYVVCESLFESGIEVTGYIDQERKWYNPFKLEYLGTEDLETINQLKLLNNFVISIGENSVRQRIFDFLTMNGASTINVVDNNSNISPSLSINEGNFISKNVTINAFVKIGDGCILNTGSIIEHECSIGNFCHIAPGSTICGNVSIGNGTLIGAGSTVLPNLKIGKNVIVGAGTIVNAHIPDNQVWVGNPAKYLKNNE